MLYIGKTHDGDDMWLTLIPQESLGRNCDISNVQDSGGLARMDPVTRRVMTAMLIWMLVDINFEHIFLTESCKGYPDIKSDTAMRRCTNFL